MTSEKPFSSDPVDSGAVYREPRGRAFALQIVAAQVVVTLLISLAGIILSNQAAIAILCGGLICSLVNFWLAMVVFRPPVGSASGKILASIYIGEIGKFILVGVFFFIAFKYNLEFRKPHNAVLIFVAYAAVQSVAWVYPLARSKIFARWCR